MNDTFIPFFLWFLVGLFIGISVMFLILYIKKASAGKKAEAILSLAKVEAEKIKKEFLNEAKEDGRKLKEEIEKEVKERRLELKESEERLLVRENNIDRRDQNLQNREQLLDEKETTILKRQKEVQEEEEKIEEIQKEQIQLLEKIAGFTMDQAREQILSKTEEQMNLEIASYMKDREAEAKLEADRKAKSMIITSMQRYAGDVANEQTISVVELPNDDMKGRIIGREGRNIRTIEAVTGVDLIIDDTPEAIVLSSFDPYRREVARVTIETLIKDGRIHPTRIEEIYDKVLTDMKAKLLEYGESALFDLGITRMDPELIELLGKLHFRTSYGQNVLQHSIEVASLAGVMAAELGENVALAKRAGLLHDIGKAIDHELEGSHVTLGGELARKFKEQEIIINAIESHHGDIEATSVISGLVAIADALSASRPGARNDSLENYMKRLHDLESVANGMPGIDKVFAVQAGRELRVLVKPEEVDDMQSYKLARKIKEKIEDELQYPGTIKITVVRETRAIEEAK